jgi:hypothetical protein
MGLPDLQRHVSRPSSEIAVNATTVSSMKLDLFANIQQVEKATLPKQPIHVHLSALRFGEADLEDQRGDHTPRPRRPSSSLTSQTLSSLDWPMDQDRTGSPLLPKRGSSLYRALRWRRFTAYYRLFTFVILANLAMFAYINYRLIRAVTLKFNDQALVRELGAILTAVSGNLTAAIALRNEHVINFLFRVFVVHVPLSAPLHVRRMIAKVYCFGGIHSGTGLMSTLWYMSFTGWTVHDNVHKHGPSTAMERAVLALTGLNWFLFVVIVTAAHPRVRSHMHDYFEASHRFCGWLLMAAFWVQTVLFCITDAGHRHVNFGKALIRIPTFWMLLVMTGLVIYPWLRAKHNFKVDVEKLSNHATRIYFKGKSIMPPCRVIRISDNICRETHAFATIPEPNGKPGYSIIVSNAGDWTNRLIQNPPEYLSVKGCPTWGILRIATMFKPVVIVATGSGIGPCLGLFNGCPNLRCRVLWSTKTPQLTYGKGVVDAVRRADPDALIYDSTVYGRIKLAQLAYNLYREIQAEAVIVISNKGVTYEVVQALECRGVAAFGPIWDS